MKKIIAICCITFSVGLFAQKINPNYDEALAKELKSDNYGMKSYFLVILKTGTNSTSDKKYIAEKFEGHMDNMARLVEDKKLVVAGPIGKNDKNYRGIFILQNIDSLEEAIKLLATDPAIEAKLLETEIYIWYGSAALPLYLEASDKIWKEMP